MSAGIATPEIIKRILCKFFFFFQLFYIIYKVLIGRKKNNDQNSRTSLNLYRSAELVHLHVCEFRNKLFLLSPVASVLIMQMLLPMKNSHGSDKNEDS